MNPITPSEAASQRQVFPPEVIQAFNELIAEKYRRGTAKVLQDDVVERIATLMNPPGFFPENDDGKDREREFRQSIFDKGWLDVEAAYRAAGWDVSFDKPAYNETYAASFLFEKRT